MLDDRIASGAQPVSLEQALNYLRAKSKTMKDDIKKKLASSQISVAPVNDRIKYLTYCISLLEEVDEDVYRLMPVNIRTMYSRRELAEFFRWFLTQKIHFATDQRLAKETGVPIDLIKDIDIYAQEACFRAIKKVKQAGLPLVGCS
jgi:hypothetical protein